MHTAEDIGSYKPDPRNFEYLIEHAKKDLDVEKAQILHVAHGVWSDQVPAEEMGLSHVWIKRGGDNWGNIEKTPDLRWWDSLGELADAVDEEFGRI